jgi:hypothetical protein
MENIGVLIDYLFSHPDDADKRSTWYHLVKKYCEAMEVLLLQQEYADKDLKSFQEKIDEFYYIRGTLQCWEGGNNKL